MATTGERSATDRVLRALADRGLLLVQDRELPNVVTLISGEFLRTSWWSHRQGRTIFAVLSALAGHEDVLIAKLLAKKRTLVHRRLWPAFLAVVGARDPWQTRGLSPAARALLDRLDEGRATRSGGAAVKQLEERLLVHVEEVHTTAGRHALVPEPWSAWARRRGVRPARSPTRAREELERAAGAYGAPRTALPWPASD